MPLRIDADRKRFENIIRGKVRDNLKKYITQDNMIGKKGNDKVSIPIHNIDIPRFTYGDKQKGGTGQGEGEEGDPMGGDPDPNGKPGSGKAGDGEGDHALEIEMSMDELADMLSQELELPNIENKGKKSIETQSHRYNGISRVGCEGLRHFKRTYKAALLREIGSGTYIPGMAIVPRREDKRYRTSSVVQKESACAAIIYMMDVSGSMGEEQKHIVRTMSFWMNAWLKKQYRGLETRYIIHDTAAKEVTEDVFFRTSESGGTTISSAYQECARVMESYPYSDWNVYCFHYSDGDNSSHHDTLISIELLKQKILPHCNMFGYGQVDSPHGSGQFLGDINGAFDKDPKVVSCSIPDRDHIADGIRNFLKKA